MNALARRGFTLIELMVAISIIAILAVIVYANLSGVGGRGRDADRQADLRNLQIAIEQYKKKNGTYPSAGCATVAETWAHENTCPVYIVGLTPDFIPVLPHDPKSAASTGYAYITNAAKTSFKVAAINTVESETVTNTHKFKRCETSGICPVTGVCATSAAAYQKTYALWGGFADGASSALVKTETAKVICK